MSFLKTEISAADIVEARLPLYTNPGSPGSDLRLCIVLAVEYDPAADHLTGLYLTRLSPRTEKIRRWDYAVSGTDIGMDTEGEFVVRTPRIDLLPLHEPYFNADPAPIGRLDTRLWQELSDKLKQGFASSFYTPSYGPREKLAHCVVASDRRSDIWQSSFDLDAIAPGRRPDAGCQGDTSRFQKEFDLARQAQKYQTSQLARLIHEDFTQARRARQPWSCPPVSSYAGMQNTLT